tara:strand:- start:223 stop:1614 length:1392 start_codon:yes stop_codon:yes gene_type:complete
MKYNKENFNLNFRLLKEKVTSGETRNFNWRIEQLSKIDNLLNKYNSEIINSLNLDLGKSKIEALSEVLLIKEEISLVKKKLRFWMRPKMINTPIYLLPISAKVIYEPIGCVLVLGPYNYPLLYILKPLVNIFSAGNTAVIKPSEKCPHTSNLLIKLIDKYFPQDTLIAYEGDYKEAEKLTSENFDHIFFTGSSKTGKLIMKIAAKNLTPVTLELSGTNPVVILENTNIKVAAKRIIWGKFFNSGQSCMAPNHLFIEKNIEEKFIKELKKTIEEFYGKDPIKSENLSRLEEKQFFRTIGILKKNKYKKQIIFGGDFDKKLLKISPTLLKVNSEKDLLIKNELFSPLLPIITIDNYQDALYKIKKTPKPLAIYIFGGNRKIYQNFSQTTSSGSICINDVMLPVLVPNLPFGGVGKSGIGKFHGEEGFKNFSNLKSITRKDYFLDINLRYPPYENVLKFLKNFFKI